MSNIHLTQNANNATSNMQAQKVELVQNEIKALGKSGLSEAEKAKKLREQCEGFESIFIQKMWQQMRATLPQENPLVGREEKFWQSMYDQELSKKMAEGGGIGLADMMYEQLSQNLVSATRTTANGVQHGAGGIPLNSVAIGNLAASANSKAFVAQPAPFMPVSPADLDEQDGSAAKDGLAQNTSKHNLYEEAAAHVNAPLYEELGTPNGQNTPQQYFVNSGQATQQYSQQAQQQAQSVANNGKMQTQIVSANGKHDNRALEAFLAGAQQTPQALAKAQAQDNGVVQQFLVGLQQKGQQGQLLTPQGVNASGAQAQSLASSNSSVSHVQGAPIITSAQSHGMQSPVVRTTYTTNIPKNQRNGDTERLVRQVLTKDMNQNASTQQAQQQAQVLAQNLASQQAQQRAQQAQEVKNIQVIPYDARVQAQVEAPPVAEPYSNPSATPNPQPVNAQAQSQAQDVGLGTHFMPPSSAVNPNVTTKPNTMLNPSGAINPQVLQQNFAKQDS